MGHVWDWKIQVNDTPQRNFCLFCPILIHFQITHPCAQYFSKLVKCICPEQLSVFLTEWLQYFCYMSDSKLRSEPQRSFRLSLFCSSLIHSWQHQCSVAQKQFSNWNIKVKQWEIHSATMDKYSWPSLRLENPGRTHSLPGEKEASASLGLFPNSSCPSSQTTKKQKVCRATFFRKYNVKVFPILHKYCLNIHQVVPWVSFHNLPSWF